MEKSSLFEKCVTVILHHEGGYVNHVSDPGGETNMGICKRSYPDIDIKNLTTEQAKEIYHRDYWKPLKVEFLLDEALALEIFDHGVNAGIGTAAKLAQRLVHVPDDGKIGPVTIDHLNASKISLVPEYKKLRKQYYVEIAQKNTKLSAFIPGWMNRVNNTKFS